MVTGRVQKERQASMSSRRNRSPRHFTLASSVCLTLVALPVQVNWGQDQPGPKTDLSGSRPANFRTSAGAGYLMHDNAQLRVEYRLAEGSSNDTVYLQTAIAF